MSNAVIAEEPSVPLILKFLSAVLTVSSTSVDALAISNIDVPPSLIVTFAPSASKIISPPESIVTSVPSAVIVSKAMLPTFVISLSPKETAPLNVTDWSAFTVKAVEPPVATVITSEPLNVIDVLESASPAIESNCKEPTFVIAASLVCVYSESCRASSGYCNNI